MKDFFISYTEEDKHWATGLESWLHEQGYTTVLQANDFLAGGNFMSKMHRGIDDAKRMILVLSPAFLVAKFPEAEWTAKLATDPTGDRRTLIPVRVRECAPPGLLRPIPYIDLVGLTDKAARTKFLNEIVAAVAGISKPRLRIPSKQRSEGKVKPVASPMTQNVQVTNNQGIIAQKVTIGKANQRKPKPKYPDGSVGANLYMYAYLDYLIDRYNEWRSDGQKFYGDTRPLVYAVIHQNVKKRFGIRTYHAPQERFEDVVHFLQDKIDRTIKGQHNGRKGIRNYHSFVEHKAKVDGTTEPLMSDSKSAPSAAGIVANVLLSGVRSARAKAQAINCLNNLKQVGTAARLWADSHEGVLPANFDSLKPELVNQKAACCPGSRGTHYEILSPGAKETEASVVYVHCPKHKLVVLADGSIQPLDDRQLVKRNGKWLIQSPV
jgi:hypothetical protein